MPSEFHSLRIANRVSFRQRPPQDFGGPRAARGSELVTEACDRQVQRSLSTLRDLVPPMRPRID